MQATLWQILGALVISITAMILLTRYLSLHAFFSLMIASLLFGLIVGKSVIDIIATMQTGFGSLLQQIGLLIAIGSCLGVMLEKTGAMEAISQRVIQLFGSKNSILAMTVIGVVVGVPVFCDSGFIILSRLIPSIASQASLNPAQLSLALSTGLYTTHTLVPPTPGPLAAAANLSMSENISIVILIGIAASLPTAFVSFLFSKKLGKVIPVDQRIHAEVKSHAPVAAWKAFVPLVLPILLIALSSLPKIISTTPGITTLLTVAGHPVVALLIGLLFSFLLIKKSQTKEWPPWIAHALKDAGIIILITGAGGAFGAVIKESGIDTILKDSVSTSHAEGVIFLLIAFVIAAVLKSAQGSSTSSMIITSSLLAPLAIAAGFTSPVHLAILIVAIGAGAMTVSHANDSYFWVVSQFSGISARDAFRTFTLLTFLQGLTALLMSVLLFFLL